MHKDTGSCRRTGQEAQALRYTTRPQEAPSSMRASYRHAGVVTTAVGRQGPVGLGKGAPTGESSRMRPRLQRKSSPVVRLSSATQMRIALSVVTARIACFFAPSQCCAAGQNRQHHTEPPNPKTLDPLSVVTRNGCYFAPSQCCTAGQIRCSATSQHAAKTHTAAHTASLISAPPPLDHKPLRPGQFLVLT